MTDSPPFASIISRPPFHLCLICMLGILAYSLSWHAPFVFDDRTTIVDNAVIRDLHRFLNGTGLQVHPRRFLGYLSFALNYRFGGLDVRGYHVVNMAIHVVAGGLTYGFCLLTLRTPRVCGSRLAPHAPYLSLFAALLFVVHPVQTESVVYVTQRFTSLATLFYLLSLSVWVKGRLQEGERRSSHGLVHAGIAAVAGGAALFTKEIAVTLPLVALVYERVFFGSQGKRLLVAVLPLAAPVVAILLLWGAGSSDDFFHGILRDAVHGASISIDDYLVTQMRVMVTYLRLLIFPAGQNLDYDYPLYHSLLSPPVLGAAFILAILAAAAVLFMRQARRGGDAGLRLIYFGIVWFFVTLLLESFVPLDDVIAEHRLYLPSVGMCIALSAAFGLMARRIGGASILLLGACVVLAFWTATVRRTVAWRSPLALWRDTVTKSPAKARPRYNLGTTLNDRGAYDEAIMQLREAVRLNPRYAQAWHNLGVAHAARGEVDDALRSYQRAITLDPNLVQAHNALGVLLQGMGNHEGALAEFRQAVVLDPLYADAHNNLGAAWGMRGRTAAAIAELEESVRLDPGNILYRSNLTRAYALQRGR